MAITVNIPIGDFRAQVLRLARDVQEMANEIGDAKEPLTDAVEQVIIPSIKRNFDVGGRPPWQPLADSTVTKRGSAGPILVHTGNLQRVATSKSIWRIDNNQAEMFIDNYGKFHQAGTIKMAERPFAILQEDDIDRVEEVFDVWVNKIATTIGRWPE